MFPAKKFQNGSFEKFCIFLLLAGAVKKILFLFFYQLKSENLEQTKTFTKKTSFLSESDVSKLKFGG